MTEREFRLVREDLLPGRHQFLVKQGHASVVCELNLRGFEAELAVMSGRASEVERLHRLTDELGPRSSDWLEVFCDGVGGRSDRLARDRHRRAHE